MKTKTIIYCRVSSREQEETGYSLDAQETLLKGYADTKQLNIVKSFKVTESASKSQTRKTLEEMLKFATSADIPVLLVEKIDRLTRNLKDAATVDEWVRVKEGREVHFVKENFVLNAHTRAHENFVWDMKVAIARFYTNNLSEEVKKGQKEKLAQGWRPCRPPVGYKTLGDKGHKTHAIDESAGPLMRRAFENYASGNYSLMAIRDRLFDDGLRTRAGGKLCKSRLDDLFRDPFYYGALRWNDAVLGLGAHEPLILKEVFDKVQDVLSGRRAPHFKRRFFQFRKMLICGECGGTITAEIKKGRYIYYHCNHYKECLQTGCTPEQTIENQLFGVFKFFETITPAEAEGLKAGIKKTHAKEIEYKENTIRTLNERYSALQRRLDVLYDDRLDNKITTDQWDRKNKEICDEQGSIQEQLSKLKSEEAKYFEIWLNIIDLAFRAREIYERRSPDERRLLLGHLFSALMLKDGEVAHTLQIPVERLAARVQQRIDEGNTLEPTQKATKGGSLRGVSILNARSFGRESLEPRNHFRTSKNPVSTVRFDPLHLKSGSLLRG